MNNRVVSLVTLLSRRSSTRFYRTSSDNLSSFTPAEAGKLYEIPKDVATQLQFQKTLPSALRKQFDTLGEVVLMLRSSFFEVAACMEAVKPSFPTIKTVLWGAFGTGKSVTLNQVVHYANINGWVVVHVPSAMDFTRRVSEVEMSTYKAGRINDPINSVAILTQFKHQNSNLWKNLSELKTCKNYEWNKNEKTAEGRPLTDIVEMGLSAPYIATDCVGALLSELKHHASSGTIKVLAAVDDANSLWGKTLVKKADRTYANAKELTLVHHFVKFISSDWSNGLVLMVADKKETSDARDQLTVPLHTPLELFGEEGFETIEPFVPVETSQYSKEELTNIYKYYFDKKWISSAEGRSEAGKLQMMHLSGFNPHYFERLAAFN
ncbi:unnamed protein product [Auanema sp. JU1783]|nr:unnamed protein product [Auanema sp. JU1783]